jgi:hypothetical protein
MLVHTGDPLAICRKTPLLDAGMRSGKGLFQSDSVCGRVIGRGESAERFGMAREDGIRNAILHVRHGRASRLYSSVPTIGGTEIGSRSHSIRNCDFHQWREHYGQATGIPATSLLPVARDPIEWKSGGLVVAQGDGRSHAGGWHPRQTGAQRSPYRDARRLNA